MQLLVSPMCTLGQGSSGHSPMCMQGQGPRVAPPSVGASLESSDHKYGEGMLELCFDCSEGSGTLVSESGFGMCLKWLEPREDGPPTGNRDTHLS